MRRGRSDCRRTRPRCGTGSPRSTTPAAWRCFAHCVSLRRQRALREGRPLWRPASRAWRRSASRQADRLARAVGLDMVEAGWRPTVDNYLGRVTKPRILEAVREAKGERAAQLIDHLKKERHGQGGRTAAGRHGLAARAAAACRAMALTAAEPMATATTARRCPLPRRRRGEAPAKTKPTSPAASPPNDPGSGAASAVPLTPFHQPDPQPGLQAPGFFVSGGQHGRLFHPFLMPARSSARPTMPRARSISTMRFMRGRRVEDRRPPDGFLLSIEPEHGGTTCGCATTAPAIRNASSTSSGAAPSAFGAHRPLGVSVGEHLLAATRQRLRRRRPCARPRHAATRSLDRHAGWLDDTIKGGRP